MRIVLMVMQIGHRLAATASSGGGNHATCNSRKHRRRLDFGLYRDARRQHETSRQCRRHSRPKDADAKSRTPPNARPNNIHSIHWCCCQRSGRLQYASECSTQPANGIANGRPSNVRHSVCTAAALPIHRRYRTSQVPTVPEPAYRNKEHAQTVEFCEQHGQQCPIGCHRLRAAPA